MKLTEEKDGRERRTDRRREEKEEGREREKVPRIKYQDAVLRGDAVPCHHNRYNRHCSAGDRLLHGQLALYRGQARPDPGSYPIPIPRGADPIDLALPRSRLGTTMRKRKSQK